MLIVECRDKKLPACLNFPEATIHPSVLCPYTEVKYSGERNRRFIFEIGILVRIESKLGRLRLLQWDKLRGNGGRGEQPEAIIRYYSFYRLDAANVGKSCRPS